MGKRILLPVIVLLTAAGIISAQQVPDLQYHPPLPRPAYEEGKGPRVAIDEAHHNFHTGAAATNPSPNSCGAMATALPASASRSPPSP